MGAAFYIQQVLNGLSFGALLFLVASGFTLVFGLMRVSNLAHGSFYLIGAFVGIVSASFTGSFIVGVVAGASAGALVGLVVQRGLLRRLANQEMAEVLVTVGVSFVIADLALVIFGGTPRSMMPTADMPSGSLVIGDFSYPWYRLFVIVFTVLIGVGLYVVQNRTRIGAIVRAGVDNREMTAAVGIKINRVFTGVFIFGALLAGLAGAIGSGVTSVSAASGTEILLYAMVVVIIGGLGSVAGAAVGATAIGLIDAFTKVWFPELAYFTVFAPMALMLVVRPRGLFGKV
jgi:branched-chain amino acid transport system permease protein